MTIKLTKNDLRRNFNHVYAVPYSELQNLLSQTERMGYNEGMYGWNWDCYDTKHIDRICIVTGYRTKGIKSVDRDLVHSYETRAKQCRKLWYDKVISYDELYEKLQSLLVELAGEILEQECRMDENEKRRK